MPSIAFHSAVPVDLDGFSLTINVLHSLFVHAPSDTVHTLLQPLPSAIDVHLISDLVFSVAGIVDGQPILPNQLAQSAVLRHLRTYLKRNSVFLGVNSISQIFSEELDGIPKFSLTPTRSFPTESPPGVLLTSLHVTYVWKRTTLESNAHIYSRQLLLPLQPVLDTAVQKFICGHVTRRYPLIFGPWRLKFVSETRFFTPLASCLLGIINRSSSSRFRKTCRRHLLRIAEGIATHRDELTSSLTSPSFSELDLIFPSALVAKELAAEDDLAVIRIALERVFRTFVRPSQFKTIPPISQPDPSHEILLDLLPHAVCTDTKPVRPNPAAFRSMDDLDQPVIFEISDTPDDLQLCPDSGEDKSSDNWTLDPNDDLCWVPALLPYSEEALSPENSAARSDFTILSDDEDAENRKMHNTAVLHNNVSLDGDLLDLF